MILLDFLGALAVLGVIGLAFAVILLLAAYENGRWWKRAGGQ